MFLASLLSPQGIIVLTLVAYLTYKLRSGKAPPPGPKGFPILGNALDFPPPGVPEYKHWFKHKDQYGPISSVSALGMTLVIIHDKDAAYEILEKSQAKTAGRPMMVFARQLAGYEPFFYGHGGDFRRHRKLMHQMLGTKAITAKFNHVQEAEVGRQLVRTLADPENWLDHLRTTTSATILKVTYGYAVEPFKPDALKVLIEQVSTNFTAATAPLAWAVDMIPALQYLPEGLPGTGFKKTARRFKGYLEAATQIPYRFVQRQMASQCHRPSYVSNLIEQCKDEGGKKTELNKEDEAAILSSSVTLYSAGTDTVSTAFTAFTMAMVINPDIQRKAKEEIERVVGSDRLPNYEDRDNLPYINALAKEVTRWWPITPMGFPHTADEDLDYKGTHIPKGSYLLPAVWWFLHDPSVYPDPETFEPERFLSPRNEPDPDPHGYGYGRHRCPGRMFADASLYINIVQSLATLDFKKAVGPDGKEIDLNPTPMAGVICHAEKFQFQVTPRSPKHAELIKRAAEEHPWEPSDAPLLETTAEWVKAADAA